MEPAAGGEMATSFVYARDGSLTYCTGPPSAVSSTRRSSALAVLFWIAVLDSPPLHAQLGQLQPAVYVTAGATTG
jgi:hypothetical protein